jgi:hypothetical protein
LKFAVKNSKEFEAKQKNEKPKRTLSPEAFEDFQRCEGILRMKTIMGGRAIPSWEAGRVGVKTTQEVIPDGSPRILVGPAQLQNRGPRPGI